MKIAIIEDDNTIGYAVETYLKKYEMEAVILKDLTSSDALNLQALDLIILDVNLPDGSGFEYLKWLRTFSKIPVILLTVKGTEEYIVRGLNLGADDYITKPFSLPVLKARIDTIFRRRGLDLKKLDFKDLSLNLTSKTASIKDRPLDLNLKEFSVLEMLLENKDISLTRETMINYVWGYDLYEVNDNTLTVTVKRLRHKLGTYGTYIKTHRGIGYMWKSDVDEEL
ncbi:MAG: response regulator transcription factor [Peptoniphilus sp.]|nr:response regulator transcription factor [Peptoniphilus sp.]MDD7363288.1 response regulator transcription factor [Bacillota bacterium]MDY6045381.1 response regulator transcription factor [Peptoniphilus sp.]